MSELNSEYWNQRYKEASTGWDLGGASPPIQHYFDQVEDKTKSILIPGAGNGHDVIELYERGFKNVYLLDFAHVPIVKFKEKYPHFPKHQIIEADFFQHKGQYDLIVEQTFFCAISPSLRHDYAQKVYDLLRPSGKLIGVLFNRHFESGPPFGGNANAYRLLFEKRFSSVEILPCYNSIEPRKCSEVFIKITK